MLNSTSAKNWWWMPLLGILLFTSGSVIGYRFGQEKPQILSSISEGPVADVIVHIDAPAPAENITGGAPPVQTIMWNDSLVVREQCISVPELLANLPFPTSEGSVRIDTVRVPGDTVEVAVSPPGDFDLTHPDGGVVATRRTYQFTRFDRSEDRWRTDVYDRGINRGMTLQGGLGYDLLAGSPNAGLQLTGFSGRWALSGFAGIDLDPNSPAPSVQINLQRTLWGW